MLYVVIDDEMVSFAAYTAAVASNALKGYKNPSDFSS